MVKIVHVLRTVSFKVYSYITEAMICNIRNEATGWYPYLVQMVSA